MAPAATSLQRTGGAAAGDHASVSAFPRRRDAGLLQLDDGGDGGDDGDDGGAGDWVALRGSPTP